MIVPKLKAAETMPSPLNDCEYKKLPLLGLVIFFGSKVSI